jgi:hypothetical protein
VVQSWGGGFRVLPAGFDEDIPFGLTLVVSLETRACGQAESLGLMALGGKEGL